ncbi:MAG: ATP synthase F1 subunit gamma [Gemmiger sp.]|uniref:ATP synthase F1 subunit gamma n=1 Tax=Gemmiger sp. TaxID=2049027 RepID=UPI002E7601BC|nr:ATP synthase F1 subunit gamma [Gemmiger sp.]MEE0800812.1 ATP synthase F1 subunit gamma [Gemmiger sp.]
MAGSMKEIKLRIKSVESTMQITKAMELVASSKLRHAKERVEQSRPYFQTLYQTLIEIAQGTADFSSPYVTRRERKKVCYIVFAGDRGLAGGYNSNIFKAVAADMQDDMPHCVLPIGKKAVEHYENHGEELVSRRFQMVGDISVSDCFDIAHLVCQKYLAGAFDEIKIAYTSFVSMLTQTATVMPVLPFEALPAEDGKPRPTLIEYEPDEETVFDAIIPEYLAGVVYGAMCESVASELGARRTAMDAATKNATEMIDNLNLYYNRARQAAITQEITEIVAGAGE